MTDIPRHIFLDIDGVLNSLNFYKSLTDINKFYKELDEEKIRMLSTIKNVDFIISSSWRYTLKDASIKDGTPEGRLLRLFKNFNLKIVGYTGYDYGNENDYFFGRSLQIIQYIIDKNLKGHFCVIDDDLKDLMPFYENGNMIKTTWLDGLQLNHINQINRILTKNKKCEDYLNIFYEKS